KAKWRADPPSGGGVAVCVLLLGAFWGVITRSVITKFNDVAGERVVPLRRATGCMHRFGRDGCIRAVLCRGCGEFFEMNVKRTAICVFTLVSMTLFLASHASAATISAAGSPAAIGTAIGSAANGDTLSIPAVSCAWSSSVSWRNIAAIGIGKDGTIISCNPCFSIMSDSSAGAYVVLDERRGPVESRSPFTTIGRLISSTLLQHLLREMRLELDAAPSALQLVSSRG